MPVVLTSNYEAIIEQIKAGAVEGLAKSGDKMKSEIIGEMYKTKSGRIYGSHQASAPGESPASDSGAFVESVEVEAESELVTAIAPAVPYSLALEYGGGRIAPRPMWVPVAQRLGGDEGQVAQIIAQEIRNKVG